MNPLPNWISVLIVGAGPTGLTAANLLARMVIEVIVLEKNPQLLQIPRAIVLDDEGARTIQAAGLIEQLMPSLVEGEGPLFFDDDGSILAQVGPGNREYGFSKRYFMHQPALEETLQRGLQRFRHAQLLFGAEVLSVQNFAGHVSVDFRHEGQVRSLRTDVVLACDGAHSTVRQMLGIDILGSTYEDEWLVIDTENDPDGSRNSKAFCHLARPFMSIPAPRGGRRYEFKLLPGESREKMATVASVQRLMAAIRPIAPADITRIAVYGFQARIAERLTDGRVLLLGDAAHLTPPFAGQGMNAGLRDAANVAWKVAMVVRSRADAKLLRTYETERREPIWAMIQLAVTMGDIIMPQHEDDRQLRAGILQKLSAYPGARDYIIGMKFKPRPRYSDGVFVDLGRPNVPASLVGCMIPQPRLRVGGQSVLLDELIGPHFAILVQSHAMEQFALNNHLHLWPELKPVVVSLADSEPGVRTLSRRAIVEEPEVAFPLHAHRDQLLLIRPDRYAALAFWPAELSRVVPQFRAALYSPAA